jgi:hypothetical protein
MMISGEKKLVCEIILSAAIRLRTIPQLCKANEGWESLRQRAARKNRNN